MEGNRLDTKKSVILFTKNILDFHINKDSFQTPVSKMQCSEVYWCPLTYKQSLCSSATCPIHDYGDPMTMAASQSTHTKCKLPVRHQGKTVVLLYETATVTIMNCWVSRADVHPPSTEGTHCYQQCNVQIAGMQKGSKKPVSIQFVEEEALNTKELWDVLRISTSASFQQQCSEQKDRRKFQSTGPIHRSCARKHHLPQCTSWRD